MYHDNTALLIQKLLSAAFSPTYLTVKDDSARHAGHAGAASGGGHFTVAISAETFKGQNLITNHRRIYAALSELLPQHIHALKIKII